MRCRCRLPALAQEEAQHRKARGTDRQVDPEDKRPAHILDEEGAERRAEDRGNAEHPREIPLDPRPLGRRVDVADDGRGNRLDRAGTGTLQRAEENQRPHPPSKATQQRSHEKQAGAGEEHRLAAIEIGQSAVDRDRHRLGQQKGGERPAEQGKPAEIGDDRRHGGGDDRALRGGQDDRHHRGRENQPAAWNGFGRKTISGGRLIDQRALSESRTEPIFAIYERPCVKSEPELR